MSSIREARRVWQAIENDHGQGKRVVLVTLVHVRGSAYRRPGAKMMMAEDGNMVGTLSGGCLEGDLFGHAEKAMQTGTPSLHHYNLTEDDMWGLGIGCKGEVDVWIEPVDPHNPFWKTYGSLIASDQSVIMGAELPYGNRFLTQLDGTPIAMTGHMIPQYPSQVGQGTAATWWLDGTLWDVMVPPSRFVIAGAGHDAQPVAQLAMHAGFDVIVLDPRAVFNSEERFAGITHWVYRAEELPAHLRPLLTGAYWVIMNHHQQRDEEALWLAAQHQPRYLGVLGPLSRTRDMLKNRHLDADALPLFAPVGLDLEAETADEVAISIVSEALAIRQGGRGGHLRGRTQIHAT